VDEGEGKGGKSGWDGFDDCGVVEGDVENSMIKVAVQEVPTGA